ncbi:hypothetical protein [Desulfovibrio psychrotolerans]|uniref:Tail fiber assembly protein n=1 Tax=Desulfovibrio psychrotolerans TaxID=415242 RepID=A0A7J0BX20_9BACT|nr:hypothetical protein [Desulfovibrio psychrotolerans]GFM37721.1 hypothetical protein DSM19430T_24050 [Desulfovibrio psychrotolerans]
MQYKYKDGSIGVARTVVYAGIAYPAASLAQQAGETTAAWVIRLAAIGVQPMRVERPDVDINSYDYGAPLETDADGVLVISYPNPIAKTPLWSTATRERMYVSAGADVPPGYTPQEPPDSPYAVWGGEAWLVDVDAARSAKRREIVSRADAFMATLTANYSEHEKLSWSKQEAEARALSVDPDAAAPLLTGIAATRGIGLLDLRDRVLANVATYEAVSAAVLGQQQRYEDQLAAAGDDAGAIAAIDPVYVLPGA